MIKGKLPRNMFLHTSCCACAFPPSLSRTEFLDVEEGFDDSVRESWRMEADIEPGSSSSAVEPLPAKPSDAALPTGPSPTKPVGQKNPTKPPEKDKPNKPKPKGDDVVKQFVGQVLICNLSGCGFSLCDLQS